MIKIKHGIGMFSLMAGLVFSAFTLHAAADTFTVAQSTLPVTADIKANGSDGPITVAYNTSASLSWISSGASSCALNGSPAAVSGSQNTGNLTASQTYTLACTGPGGGATDSVSVNVNAAPAPSNVSSSASPSSISRSGSSVITAIVRDQYGAVMAGTSVSFSLTGAGSVNPASAITDASGQASTTYIAPSSFPGSSMQASVSSCAGAPCSTATVTVTKK